MTDDFWFAVKKAKNEELGGSSIKVARQFVDDTKKNKQLLANLKAEIA